jgi:serine/threonine-protein kinase
MADPEVSKAADIFSLGAILFEILTLVPLRDPKAPFVPADARPTSRAPSRGVAPELDVICVKATADEPADRYASARALQEAVSRFLEGDRDRELRKGRAAAHARAAREALGQAESQGADYEAARGVAMRELTRALAFDASNRDAVAMLGEILAKPPRTVPDEVRKQIDADSIRTSRAFARYIGPTMASWFLFLPPLLAIGIHDWHVLPLIVVPVFLAMILGFWQASHRIWSTTSQITTLIVVMIALSSVTFLYGPLVVTPAMISSAAVVVQAFPVKALRRTALVSALVLMTLLVVLELTGVTSVYAFAGGHWSVLPQLVELPRVGTLLIMLAIHMGTMILPSMFISQLRGDLARAQQNQLLQAWHFRRLGDQLMQV